MRFVKEELKKTIGLDQYLDGKRSRFAKVFEKKKYLNIKQYDGKY